MVFVLLLHFAQWLSWGKLLLGGCKAFKKHVFIFLGKPQWWWRRLRVCTAIYRSLCLCAPFLVGIDCATAIGWCLCVALASCAMALLGQAFVGWWPSIQETHVFISLGKPQWRWQHIEYSHQSLALCMCALLCWPVWLRSYCMVYLCCSCTLRSGSAGISLCWVVANHSGNTCLHNPWQAAVAVAAHGILTSISRSLSLCAPFLTGIDCATVVGWFLCVAPALCAIVLLGQAFVGWWPNIQELNVFIILGQPQWRWQHIEYSPQPLALCVCALPCWPV